MLQKLAADSLLESLDQLEYGSLTLTMPNGQTYSFSGKAAGPDAHMTLNDWRVPMRMAQKGDTGLAEDYRDGLWRTDNLEDLITLALLNEGAIRNYLTGSPAMQILGNLSYMLKLNTLKGSRRNIHAHYDLGNDFYKLWLDPTMTYSSAIFKHHGENLVQAQHNKYDRMIDGMAISSGRVLEIGCGWGGFAERAADRGDYAIKGITLSDEQHDFARARLQDRAWIALEDYRDQQGKFDSIVSIEMFEAVGERYWPTYFNKIRTLLKHGGKAMVQTITIDDARFQSYRRGSDFIRSYIFPGGMLPSESRFAAEAQKAGLRVNDTYKFGLDYARTLEVWLQNFDARTDAVRGLGFDDGFIRLWRFYLAACIAGFRTGRIDVMQVEMEHV